jgi:prepilin-type N-terminal cleavage/methylation domain-containing protein
MDGKLMDRTIESGFTIVEILIAIVIIAATAVVISMFMKGSLIMQTGSKGAELAYLTAEDKLSELTAAAIPKINGSDTVFVSGQRFIRTWDVTIQSYIRKADISVQFSYLGRSRTIQFTGAIN